MHGTGKKLSLYAAASAAVLVLVLAMKNGKLLLGRQTSAEPAASETTATPTVTLLPLEPTTRDVLIGRSSDTFLTGYFTFVAIIQGAALALLAQQVVTGLPRDSAVSRVVLLGEATAALTAIIVISYEYLWLLTVMRWAPTFTDTLAPYMLGASEVVGCLLIGQKAWWIAAVCFFGTCAAVLAHSLLQCSDALFDGKHHLNALMKRLLRRQIFCCLIGVGAATATSINVFTANYVLVTAAASWAAPLVGAAVVILSERDLNTLYEDYGVPRRMRDAIRASSRPGFAIGGHQHDGPAE
jgi:hypothetical protein